MTRMVERVPRRAVASWGGMLERESSLALGARRLHRTGRGRVRRAVPPRRGSAGSSQIACGMMGAGKPRPRNESGVMWQHSPCPRLGPIIVTMPPRSLGYCTT